MTRPAAPRNSTNSPCSKYTTRLDYTARNSRDDWPDVRERSIPAAEAQRPIRRKHARQYVKWSPAEIWPVLYGDLEGSGAQMWYDRRLVAEPGHRAGVDRRPAAAEPSPKRR